VSVTGTKKRKKESLSSEEKGVCMNKGKDQKSRIIGHLANVEKNK